MELWSYLVLKDLTGCWEERTNVKILYHPEKWHNQQLVGALKNIRTSMYSCVGCALHNCKVSLSPTDPIFNQIPWKLWVWGCLWDFRTRTEASDRYKSRAGGRSPDFQKKGRELLRVFVGLWDDATPAGRQVQLSRGDSGERITD